MHVLTTCGRITITICCVDDGIQETLLPTYINEDSASDFVMTPRAATNDPWKSHTLGADSSFSASDSLWLSMPSSTEDHSLSHAQHNSEAPQQLRLVCHFDLHNHFKLMPRAASNMSLFHLTN